MRHFIISAAICLMTALGAKAIDLPHTWRMPFMNGYIETTLHEDGRLTSVTCTPCVSCGGMGMCAVCGGTGGQYWYGMGIQPCGRCYGAGRCQTCGGKGYCMMNSTTQYGVTVGYDERGNMYVAGGAGSSSATNRSDRHKTEVIEYLPTFGVAANENVYCRKCGKTTARHIHVLK